MNKFPNCYYNLLLTAFKCVVFLPANASDDTYSSISQSMALEPTDRVQEFEYWLIPLTCLEYLQLSKFQTKACIIISSEGLGSLDQGAQNLEVSIIGSHTGDMVER